MHELFAQVLSQRDLSAAGDLFSIEDVSIVDDLSAVLKQIEVIASSSSYLTTANDQSVVEICITRVTLAIRETDSIEQHANALVSLLESCLQHNLKPSVKEEDPPHAKIAADILSCVFLNYGKKTVMAKALPVAVRFLLHENKELSRNLSSYLSLAAIENAPLLAQHLAPIMESIVQHGNKTLLRVLPQIYKENMEPVHDSIGECIKLLADCDMAEKTSVLQLCVLIADEKPRILEQHIPTLMEYLGTPATATPILTAFVSMATTNPEPFLGHLTSLKQMAEKQPGAVIQVARVMCEIGKINKKQAKDSVAYLVSQLTVVDQQGLPVLLKEMKGICDVYPTVLAEFMPEINKYSQNVTVTTRIIVQQLKDLCSKSGSIAPERKTVGSQTEGVVTVIDLENQKLVQSHSKSLLAQPSSANLPDSKNASTSTREISFPQTSTSTTATTVVATSSAAPSTPATSSQLSISTTALSATVSVTSPVSTVAITLPASVMGTHASTSTTATFTSSSQTLPAMAGTVPGRPRSAGTPSRLQREERRSLPSAMIHQTTVPPPYTSQPHAIPFRDAVQQFCEKHMAKIKQFVQNAGARLPIPIKASLDEIKHKRYCRLHFICYGQGEHCLYSHNFFSFRTRLPRTWIHIMFLAIQARSDSAVSQQNPSVGNLKAAWDSLKVDSGNSFVRLVTSTFPSQKDQDNLLQELHNIRYFDVFEFDAASHYWACFLCNHPEKATGLLQDGLPAIEGQLKEKKGRWKFLKRWKTRYFTLSGAMLTYSKKDSRKATLPVSQIHTVKAVRRGMREIPRAFEIFTQDQTYVFKAKDGQHAEKWVQCLQIALARTQKQPSGVVGGNRGPSEWTAAKASSASRITRSSRYVPRPSQPGEAQTKL